MKAFFRMPSLLAPSFDGPLKMDELVPAGCGFRINFEKRTRPLEESHREMYFVQGLRALPVVFHCDQTQNNGSQGSNRTHLHNACTRVNLIRTTVARVLINLLGHSYNELVRLGRGFL